MNSNTTALIFEDELAHTTTFAGAWQLYYSVHGNKARQQEAFNKMLSLVKTFPDAWKLHGLPTSPEDKGRAFIKMLSCATSRADLSRICAIFENRIEHSKGGVLEFRNELALVFARAEELGV